MAHVQESTLSWLYSVLHEYQDPQRTYSDAARTLSVYPSLNRPQTKEYTYENGTSALLLKLSGTLPTTFRGATYQIPIAVWIAHTYPYEAPMVYVEPGKDMLVRPGQHVDVNGRIYHPYLRDWSRMWDRANITEFLGLLVQAFSKETPVHSRPQQPQQQSQRLPLSIQQQQQGPGASPTPPQLPPKQAVRSPATTSVPNVNTPPPLPPKPGEEYAEPARGVAREGPPLPPLPHEAAPPHRVASVSQHVYRPDSRVPSQTLAAPSSGHQNGRLPGPALPPLPHEQAPPHHQQYRASQDRSPVSPVSPVNGVSELPANKYVRPAPLPQPQFQRLQQQPVQQPAPYAPHQPQYQQTYARAQPPPQQQHLPQQGYHPSQAKQKQPAPDLLTDPFDVALPASGPSLPAPPIPPNPEKEHLLQALSSALVQQAQQKAGQNLAAIAPLQAQQQAMLAAQDQLDGEIRQMEQLEQALSNNEAILHRSIQDCDRTIATAKSKKQPPIDEVLLAPTMVANQLWNLCAEEAACREAMYVLQKAVDRGRISGNDFVRQMRGLGRECFLKMALARKCASGMGLDTREMPR